MAEKKECELGWVRSCRSCERSGNSYEHGSELLEGATLLECSDGEWVENIYTFIGTGP